MARDASAFDISTKPKPRGRPVSRSVIRETFSTVPWLANRARTASSVAVKGRFPTYSLVTADYSREKRIKTGRWSCLLVRRALRGWQTLAGKRAAGGAWGGQGKTSRKVTSRAIHYRSCRNAAELSCFGHAEFTRCRPRASDFATHVVEPNAPPQLMPRAS